MQWYVLFNLLLLLVFSTRTSYADFIIEDNETNTITVRIDNAGNIATPAIRSHCTDSGITPQAGSLLFERENGVPLWVNDQGCFVAGTYNPATRHEGSGFFYR